MKKNVLFLIAIPLMLSACKGNTSSIAPSSSINSSSEQSSITQESSSSEQTTSYQDSCSMCIGLTSSASSSSEAFSSSTSSSSSKASSSSQASSSSAISSSSSNSSSSNFSSSQKPSDGPYSGYYDSLVSWTNGEDLKNQLHAIIRNGYRPLSYTKSSKQNYDTNSHADHSKYDFENLDIIYSQTHCFKTETNKGWQREHAWCASLMCGKTTGDAVATRGRATDFHNLFAAEAGGNQSRGNKNYGNADRSKETYTSRLSIDGNDGYCYDETVFEPGNYDKGRVARAIFYMATMYKDAEDGMDGLRILEDNVIYPFEAGRGYAIGYLNDLLSWNNTYQVDYLEMQHNITVYSDDDNPDGYAQGNRNPFVDYPGLVDYIYGSKKNQAGTLADVVASASYLNCENKEMSHYAVKEAKREYEAGDTLKASDYKVVAVSNDYSYVSASSGIQSCYDNYTFKESDGNRLEAVITTPINTISYQIILSPMGLCSTGVLPITTTGISKKTPDVDQNISLGSVPFTFNFSTTYSDVTTNGMTINNIGAGGITVGSTNRVLTKLTLTTRNSYTVDTVYIKAQAGNASSVYNLKILVGETVAISGRVSDNTAWKVFGGALEEPLTGQISFVFTGTSCLKINSIAFNSISS